MKHLVNEIFDFMAGLGEDYWRKGDERAPSSHSANKLLSTISNHYRLPTFEYDIDIEFNRENQIFETVRADEDIPSLVSAIDNHNLGRCFSNEGFSDKELLNRINEYAYIIVHDNENDTLYHLGNWASKVFDITYERDEWDWHDCDVSSLVLMKWSQAKSAYYNESSKYVIVLTKDELYNIMKYDVLVNFLESDYLAYASSDFCMLRFDSVHYDKKKEKSFYDVANCETNVVANTLSLDKCTFIKRYKEEI